METLLTALSLVSFAGLILGWVALPHSSAREVLATTPEAAAQPAATAA